MKLSTGTIDFTVYVPDEIDDIDHQVQQEIQDRITFAIGNARFLAEVNQPPTVITIDVMAQDQYEPSPSFVEEYVTHSEDPRSKLHGWLVSLRYDDAPMALSVIRDSFGRLNLGNA